MIKMGEMGSGRLVEIEMYEDGLGELDEVAFFDDGRIAWGDDGIATVYDIDYCVDYANDWAARSRDFAEDDPDDDELPERQVIVTPLCYVFQCGNDGTGTGDGVILRTFYTFREAQLYANELNGKLSEDAMHCYIAVGENGEDIW